MFEIAPSPVGEDAATGHTRRRRGGGRKDDVGVGRHGGRPAGSCAFGRLGGRRGPFTARGGELWRGGRPDAGCSEARLDSVRPPRCFLPHALPRAPAWPYGSRPAQAVQRPPRRYHTHTTGPALVPPKTIPYQAVPPPAQAVQIDPHSEAALQNRELALQQAEAARSVPRGGAEGSAATTHRTAQV